METGFYDMPHFIHDFMAICGITPQEYLMEQKVIMDLGVHVAFDGFSLQSNYPELVGADLPVKTQPNNFQLYFEVEDLDYWQDKINRTEGIEFIHKAKEYPWEVFVYGDTGKVILLTKKI